jgi:hypothetical protein
MLRTKRFDEHSLVLVLLLLVENILDLALHSLGDVVNVLGLDDRLVGGEK